MSHTKIKTFEDACRVQNLAPNLLPDVSALPEKHQKSLVAYYKLRIVAEALNEGWEADWSDHDQYKYFPWFYVDANSESPSGSGLSCHDADLWYTHTSAASRLCYKSHELAKYAGKQFEDLYKDYLLL